MKVPERARRAETAIDMERARALAEVVAAGEGSAFRALCETLWPFWTQVARRTRALTLLGRGEDAVRDVATAIAEKLAKEDHRALRQWQDWSSLHRDRSFEDWMSIVTTNAVRSYIRKQTAAAPGVDADPTRNRVLRDFFASIDLEHVGETPSMTPKQTARQIVELARARLPPKQLRALSLWLESWEVAEIASELGLRGGAEEARKLVRAACATLRREFAT